MSGHHWIEKWRVCWWLVLVGVFAIAGSRNAHAQVSNEKAAAEALFDQGVTLLKQGKYEKACKKLESSQRIDPGIGTLLYLGDCYERLGRHASAWATFREAASKAEAAGEADRARVGTQRADALEPKLARVTIQMAEENMDIADLRVAESGKEMNRALWGSPVPVDPGQLKVVVEAPGYEPFQAMLTVREGTSDNSLDIPPLVAQPQPQVERAEQTESPAATPEDSSSAAPGRRVTGYILGGVGLLGIGIGTGYGIRAISKNSKSENRCGDVCTEGQGGADLATEAANSATVSTAGLIAGGVLFATGVVLVLTSPKARQIARVGLTPTKGGAHLMLGGSF